MLIQFWVALAWREIKLILLSDPACLIVDTEVFWKEKRNFQFLHKELPGT